MKEASPLRSSVIEALQAAPTPVPSPAKAVARAPSITSPLVEQPDDSYSSALSAASSSKGFSITSPLGSAEVTAVSSTYEPISSPMRSLQRSPQVETFAPSITTPLPGSFYSHDSSNVSKNSITSDVRRSIGDGDVDKIFNKSFTPSRSADGASSLLEQSSQSDVTPFYLRPKAPIPRGDSSSSDDSDSSFHRRATSPKRAGAAPRGQEIDDLIAEVRAELTVESSIESLPRRSTDSALSTLSTAELGRIQASASVDRSLSSGASLQLYGGMLNSSKLSQASGLSLSDLSSYGSLGYHGARSEDATSTRNILVDTSFTGDASGGSLMSAGSAARLVAELQSPVPPGRSPRSPRRTASAPAAGQSSRAAEQQQADRSREEQSLRSSTTSSVSVLTCSLESLSDSGPSPASSLSASFFQTSVLGAPATASCLRSAGRQHVSFSPGVEEDSYGPAATDVRATDASALSLYEHSFRTATSSSSPGVDVDRELAEAREELLQMSVLEESAPSPMPAVGLSMFESAVNTTSTTMFTTPSSRATSSYSILVDDSFSYDAPRGEQAIAQRASPNPGPSSVPERSSLDSEILRQAAAVTRASPVVPPQGRHEPLIDTLLGGAPPANITVRVRGNTRSKGSSADESSSTSSMDFDSLFTRALADSDEDEDDSLLQHGQRTSALSPYSPRRAGTASPLGAPLSPASPYAPLSSSVRADLASRTSASRVLSSLHERSLSRGDGLTLSRRPLLALDEDGIDAFCLGDNSFELAGAGFSSTKQVIQDEIAALRARLLGAVGPPAGEASPGGSSDEDTFMRGSRAHVKSSSKVIAERLDDSLVSALSMPNESESIYHSPRRSAHFSLPPSPEATGEDSLSAHSLLSSSTYSLGSLASTAVSSVFSVGSLSAGMPVASAGQKKSLAAAGPARLSALLGSKFSVDSFGLGLGPGQRLSHALGGSQEGVGTASSGAGPLLQRQSLDSESDGSDGSLLTASSLRFV